MMGLIGFLFQLTEQYMLVYLSLLLSLGVETVCPMLSMHENEKQ